MQGNKKLLFSNRIADILKVSPIQTYRKKKLMPLPRIPKRNEEPEEGNDFSQNYDSVLPEVEEDEPQAAPTTSAPSRFLPTSMPVFSEDDEEEDAGNYIPLAPIQSSEEYEEETPVLHDDWETPAPVATTPAPAPSVFDEPEDETETALDNAVRALPSDIQDAVEKLLFRVNETQSSEVLMNGPSEIMIKVNGGRFHVSDIDFKDIETYHFVINNFLLPFVDTKDRIKENSYLIEGQMELPDMEDTDAPPTIARVHILAPPAVKAAKVTIAKKARNQFTIDDLVSSGSMTENMGEFLKIAAKGKLTTILSGLSGSGKTTLLEAMSHHFDQDDRILVVEDTQELMLPISDVVYMRSQLARPGESDKEPITLEWLVSQANRMRPDRIIIGEVRGGEMSEFLVAANSGADGSMTTVHAGSPKLTLSKIASLAMKNGTSKNEDSIIRDISGTIQLIVQAALIDGKHVITHIEEVSNTVNNATKAIATQTIYEYDRGTQRHYVKGRPSERLETFLSQRGIKLEPQLFRDR